MASRRSRRKRKHRGSGIYIFIIVLLLIFIAGVVLYSKFFGYSKERADLNDYYSLTSDEQAGVVIDNSVMGGAGLVKDGSAYVEYPTVANYVSSRFYVDTKEKVLLYALPNEVITIKPDEDTYNVGGEEVTADCPVWTMEGKTPYISLDFLKQFSPIAAVFAQNPNRIMITTKFGEVQVAEAKHKAQVRKLAGVKSPVLKDLKKGDKLTFIDDTVDDWYHVRTEDGFIGYVPVKDVSDFKAHQTTCEYTEPEFTHTLEDQMICLAFDNVTNTVANEYLADRLKNTRGINVLAPTWYSVADTKGNIDSIASRSYVKKAHRNDIKVWATVRDFDSENGIGSNKETYKLLSRTSVRQKMVKKIVSLANKAGIDGINVDFEKISAKCGTHYVQFVRELSIRCRQNGLVLSVDNYVPKLYNGHYGRKEQGVFADYVVIMGYDEHTYGSDEAGSVASYDFVEDGIEKTIADVPSERVVNAIPFYTRIWEEKKDDTLTFRSYGMAGAAAEVKKAGAKAKWDDDTHQNYAQWKDGGSTFKVWLEDKKSVSDKLDLMNEYNLAGIGCWRLGQESSDVWPLINNYLMEE